MMPCRRAQPSSTARGTTPSLSEQRTVRLEAEHGPAHRFVVHELQLVVAGDDLGVARVTLERGAVEDRRRSGGGGYDVRGVGGARGRVGHGPGGVGALALGDVI